MTQMQRQASEPLVGWLPYRLELTHGEPTVHWVRCPGPLDDAPPKFGPTAAALRAAGHEQVATGVEALAQTRARAGGLQPNGFLFHIARCGSTLVSNVLSALPDALVIKEAQPIDECLRTDLSLPHVERARWLVDVVGALGQRFAGDERSYYLKFTSWNVLHHGLIRDCFPDTPSAFLYRDPLETLVSMLRAEPVWEFEVVPGLERQGRSNAEYYARVIGAFLASGLELAAAGGRLVAYSELGTELLPRVLAAFGVPDSAQVASIIEAQRSVYSKDPRRRFVPDADEKRREASPEARDAVERWALPAFTELERVRAEQRTTTGGHP
jgi:hypothetical protein